MKSFVVSGLLTVLTCAYLICLVLWKAPRSRLGGVMAAFNAAVVVWGLGTLLVGLAKTPEQALWAWRIAYVGGLMDAVFVYQLSSLVFAAGRLWLIRIVYVFGIITSLLTLAGPSVLDVRLADNGAYYGVVNWFFVLEFVGWLSCVIAAHRMVYLAWRRSTGGERNQLRLLFIAIAIGYLGGTSVILPVFSLNVSPFGNFLVPIYALIVTYAILRHRFLGVQTIIRRGLVYSLLTTFVTVTYLVIVVLAERYLQGIVGYRSLIGTIAAAIVVAIGFIPAHRFIQRCVDSLLLGASSEHLAQENHRLRQELVRSDATKAVAVLASGLAHEIKCPLTTIKIFTEHLPDQGHAAEFRNRFSRIVGGELERIHMIAQRLLDFAKPTPPTLEPVRVIPLIDQILEFLALELVQRQVQVVRRYDADVQVLGDGKQLKQVLLNIVLNSLQAMDGAAQLEIATEIRFGDVQIIVVDSGHGIPSHHLRHIFEPFFTTKPSGTGLGLAVVRGIIEEHDGRIDVTSQVGLGTRVTISFPIWTAERLRTSAKDVCFSGRSDDRREKL